MGTRFDVLLRAPANGFDEAHLEAVAAAVCEEFQRLDTLLSRFKSSSEIARLNREAGARFVRVDRELFALLTRCEQGRLKTNGYFDVTRSAALQLEATACAVRLTHPEAVLDLGAIGKGYALDCGRELMLRYGVTDGLLQGGTSSILAMGEAAWPIAVRHPLQPERIVTQLALTNCGFSCSAVRHNGQAQSDIFNPHTQTPLTGDAACFVLAATATEAEIYSTALLAMGREVATAFLAATEFEVGWLEG